MLATVPIVFVQFQPAQSIKFASKNCLTRLYANDRGARRPEKDTQTSGAASPNAMTEVNAADCGKL